MQNWRDDIWQQIEQPWDVIVIGGGITGAGVLREAARLGLRVLLVEQRDFAWGTSSRSSKMVHGGLRYLAQGQLRLTYASVREREHLLADAPGLVEPLGFLIAMNRGQRPGRWTYSAALTIYDLMAQQWTHRRFSLDEFRMLTPHISGDRLAGGFRYEDAWTDDARLVLRLLHEAVADGASVLNYVRALELLREGEQVVGVRLHDEVAGRSAVAPARVTINATGAWADVLRSQVGAAARIRPLRGSHLIFPAWRLPVAQAIAFPHPLDRRPVFAYPWEGITLVGTTDVDHDSAPNHEPSISPDEVAYLMAAVTHQFPSRGVTLDDVISTYAGVRPVIGTGKEDPSKESRDYVVWHENGLITITGGKLTTFRILAHDALKAARARLPNLPPLDSNRSILNAVEDRLPAGLDHTTRRRLLGRYGADATRLVEAAQPGELECIPGTPTLWAELRWAARAEGAVHLDDLLLRRTRLGLLLPQGGVALLPRLRAICQPELGWDDARWEAEVANYHVLWAAHYSLPDRRLIPDWNALLQASRQESHQRSWVVWLPLVLLALTLLVIYRWRQRQKPARFHALVNGG